MRTVGMFKAKTHLTELIKLVEDGENLCITNRGKKVAIIISVNKYYKDKHRDIWREFFELKKLAPIGTPEEIIEMKNFGRK